LTVDDHPVVRNGIAELLEDQADMILVGEASNGRDAIQRFRAHQPDVTLMHLQMAEMSASTRLSRFAMSFRKRQSWCSPPASIAGLIGQENMLPGGRGYVGCVPEY
jgi:DNA-binding NarL/FixJ family response regulator